MSKTVDELIGVYIEASNAVVWEAEKRDLCPMTLDMQRAGIAAVVRAVRDEMIAIWNAHGDPVELLDEILGSDAGNEKVAGGTNGEGAAAAEPNVAAPATDPIRNAVAMARGRALAVDDIPTLNKLAAMMSPATDPAPAVCEWTPQDEGPAHEIWKTACGTMYERAKSTGWCNKCKAPIQFTEAKT